MVGSLLDAVGEHAAFVLQVVWREVLPEGYRVFVGARLVGFSVRINPNSGSGVSEHRGHELAESGPIGAFGAHGAICSSDAWSERLRSTAAATGTNCMAGC